MKHVTPLTEAEIFSDAIMPDAADLSPEATEWVSNWKFSDRAIEQMRLLLDQNNKGVLTQTEAEELDRYRRVGMLLDFVQAKIRMSLNRPT